MQIRPAFLTEAEAISALAIRSKAIWGYPEEQMAIFRQELLLSEGQIVSKQTHVIENDGEIAGYYTLLPHDERTLELEHLFVEPTKLRQGYGSQLFHHACQTALKANFQVLVVQSDPNAADFYKALGGYLTREIPSSIPGRLIPYFEFNLEKISARSQSHGQ